MDYFLADINSDSDSRDIFDSSPLSDIFKMSLEMQEQDDAFDEEADEFIDSFSR